MKFDPQKHHRRSIRAAGYDYSRPGGYFVTIVTHGRACLFGEVVEGEVVLNDAGKIVQWEFERLAQRFQFLELGTFIVMPNHAHAIIIIHSMKEPRDGHVGATRAGLTNAPSGAQPMRTEIPEENEGSPLPPTGPAPSSLGAIIAQFKSRVTKRLWKIPTLAGTPIWQRNYYEHIIRNDDDYNRIHNYIQCNPIMWNDDVENRA